MDSLSADGQSQVPQEPDKVTVIVHSAKNLQSRKKGRCKFSVIFGVGSKKFRTDVIEDVFGGPVWNTEAEIEVDSAHHHLNLVATEKDEPLGQVVIPLGELPSSRPYQGKRVTLGPHKKCADPVGELVVSAWVSATRPQTEGKGSSSSPSGPLKGLKKMKSKISHSPLMRRKSRGSGEVAGSGGMKGSMSMGDLAGMGRRRSGSNLMVVPSDSLCSINSTDSDTSTTGGTTDIRDSLRRPEVSGISPREGPLQGGTRLTIRGVNLGRSRDDIKVVSVCGNDCTATVQYESTSKLYVTTPLAARPGPGDIFIETVSGGPGTSMVQFKYIQEGALEPSPGVTKRLSPHLGGKSRMSPLMTHKKRLSDTSTLSAGSIPEETVAPDVSGLSPREGPPQGGTVLTLRGDRLGLDRHDILSVSVCGQDCTASLQYHSPSKLQVTTRPARPGPGKVVVETASGGRATSTLQFVVAEATPHMALNVEMTPNTVRRFTSAPSPAFSDDDDDDEDNLLRPEVTGISPKEGSVDGNTRLTIRGINLGRNRGDVLALTVCGANCLPMMEYESPMKLIVTTPPWKPGPGPIVVETQQGGRGACLVQYTFKRTPLPPPSPTAVAGPVAASVPSPVASSTPGPVPSFTSMAPDTEQNPPLKPPRKTPSPVAPIAPKPLVPSVDLGALDLTDTPEEPPDILVTSSTPREAETISGISLDETDDFGGATPYPEEVKVQASEISRVDSAPTGTVAMVMSGRMSRSRNQSNVDNTMTTPVSTKRQAPLPPLHQKPPLHPSSVRASPNNMQEARQLPRTPGDTRSDITHDKNYLNEQTKHYIEENSDMFKKEQQEQHTQSGPTRPELMEELRRLKLENRELRDCNLTIKKYLESLLSQVMLRCPELLCVDHTTQ